MSLLICPRCRNGTLRWLDPDSDNLLESIMVCQACKTKYKGMQEFHNVWMKKENTDEEIKDVS